MHVPQSVEAATELREIAAVPKQLISPRLSKPLISVVQDTLVGVNRLTRPTEFFTRREFMNLLVHSKRWDGRVPPPAKTDPIPLWSGQQVVSCLLPQIHVSMGNKMWDEKTKVGDHNYVIIKNGEIKQGTLDGDVFDKALIHMLYNDFSPEMTVDFIDSLQAVVAAYLQNSGFSVGLSDLTTDADTLATITQSSEELKTKIESLQLQVHTGLFDNTSGRSNQEEFESKVFQTLNKATTEAGKRGLTSLSKMNRMVNMVKCGSKGSDVNIAQMIALLGQQAIEGKRIAYGFQDRTLPHFKRYDDGAEARGYIESSFVKGLSPAEFFFHAMTGREGLIDTAVKTADSGYLQRQLIKTMEDLMIQHDGTVRDAGGLMVQYSYGGDGTSATKIENQPIGLGGMSDAEITARFTVEDVAGEKAQAYLGQVFADRDMLVRNVWAGRVEKSVQSAVHLPRLIANAIQQLGLAAGTGAPVPGAHVLETIERIIQQTSPTNALWAALLRFHLNPRDLRALGFTRAAFDWLAEQIVIRHLKSWATPGEMVGILAAQSLGEPTTQMTLNSVDWDTEIIIACDGKILTPRIGEFIDEYILGCDEDRIQRLPNDQLYVALDDGHDWKALSPDENGVMKWTKLEAITKHPVINADGSDTILEVETESGRIVKATKAKSFLRFENGKLVACDGSDIRIGDLLPVANTLATAQIPASTTLSVSDYLPKTEWLYGSDVAAAKAAMGAADAAGERHWFSHANGKEFTVPYARSDSFREAFEGGKNMHADAIRPNCVYPKKLWKTLSHIPEQIPLDRAFGFFCGAFVAEGSTSSTQIQITNNDDAYLAPIRALLDSWSVGHHTVAADKEIQKTGISGHTQSLVIHSTLLTALMRALFGRISYEKTLPAWVLQAPDAFTKGLVDGYFSGDGYVGADGRISASSVSKPLVERLAALLSSYGIFSTFSAYTPALGRFASVQTQYKLDLPVAASFRFAQLFDLTIQHKQDRLAGYVGPKRQPKWAEFADMMLDRVVSIKEIKPMTDRVYDLTVEGTRNFMALNGLALRDTFHLSGVAAKSGMTRGVPRLKELLYATPNPKATSLTIYLRPDIRDKKEEARRLAQELEFTMLKDITRVARVYYDPRDSATLVADDAEWLAFFSMFEQDAQIAELAAKGVQEDVGDLDDLADRSPWIIRLEMDREKMFNKNITMEDVAYVLRKGNPETDIAYTDHNSTRMVFRIRGLIGKDTALDDLARVKASQNKILTQTLVRGLPGLRSVSFRKTGKETNDMAFVKNPANDNKYEEAPEFVLDTLGSNFLDVMIHPDIDGSRLASNHIFDIYENLGIEAARLVLNREVYGLFEQAGAAVNGRHVSILCDAMCSRGKIMPANRLGVNKKLKIGPLAKASFEQSEDIMLRAAMFGEMDPVAGVSANIMTGQPIRGGTSLTQILLDEAALQELVSSAPPPRKTLERAPQLAQAEVERLLEAKETPGCRPVDIEMPAALPVATGPVGAPEELPELEIVLVDE